MTRVFITGAAGFIGSYVAEEFIERDWHVTALVHRQAPSRTEPLNESGRITYAKGDITSYDSLRDALLSTEETPSVIVHCAGRASDVGRRDRFRETNLTSVQHLVRLTKEAGINRLVFISTTDVYGLRDFEGEAEGELNLDAYPPNPYPEFKIRAEDFIRKELPPDRFAILRPAQVWGVGDTTLSSRIIDFLKWSPWILHFGKWQGQNRWPLAHVRNVALAAYLSATLPEAAGQSINVLDSENTTIDDFYRILAKIYLPEKSFKTLTLPFCLGRLVGALVSGVSNLLDLDHPFMDPSLYALYAVSRNLDFSSGAFRRLAADAGEKIVTRDQGVAELALKEQ